ncbi:MAG: hypothetical protein FIA97_12570 [Methylococcaceae bacterium]|nr:hypothetical protein [Methylococcaceae bacterium]
MVRRRLPRPRFAVFREAGAALLFFGVLAQQPELQEAGGKAVAELAALGYRVPAADDPVRVFPALTGGEFSGSHAGGWRPGQIYLRNRPEGGHAASVYLRHELFHEASHRSCGGRLPRWAEEAGALWFSGELAGRRSVPSAVSEEALEALRGRIRQGSELNSVDRSLLADLMASFGWPAEPCAASPRLSEKLGIPFDDRGGGGYLLVSLLSGRVLESGGDQQGRYPPGSLLKLPYAAALTSADPVSLGAELAASDTGKLLARRDHLDLERYRLLLSPVKGHRLLVSRGAEPHWPSLVGERDRDGAFPLEANLRELAWMVRASLLARPGVFQGLSRNGSVPESTLAGQDDADRQVLAQLHALAKTGTASDPRGNPLVGHLAVAWPAEHPVFLALFRQRGIGGAGVLPYAARWLRPWRLSHPVGIASVRVRLFSLTPRSSWQALEDCPAYETSGTRISLCGEFRLISAAAGSRSERKVRGILRSREPSGPVVLETDGDSYADAVLQAEAQELKGSARAAMRAVILWNGAHGGHRHGDTGALCDTTHCMVYVGEQVEEPIAGGVATDPGLLHLLDRLAQHQRLDWLPFSAGGSDRWERRVAAAELENRLGEKQLLELRRERRRDGAITVHLMYPDGEETVACEIFRNAIRLPSCPDAIVRDSVTPDWLFRGIGAGHGMGLEVARAKALSEGGRSAEEILRDAYGN